MDLRKQELPSPNENESREDFMSRCTNAGGSEEACAARWRESRPAPTEATEQATRGREARIEEQMRRAGMK